MKNKILLEYMLSLIEDTLRFAADVEEKTSQIHSWLSRTVRDLNIYDAKCYVRRKISSGMGSLSIIVIDEISLKKEVYIPHNSCGLGVGRSYMG